MNTIHLTTLTDSNFLIPTIVMMTSARETMAPDSHYHFHLFHSNLEPWQIDAFRQLETDHFTVTIRQLHESDNQFTHLPNCGRHGQAALMRLNLPNLLRDIDKVIYLDGDIIVTKDLAELYDTPLGDHPLAAVEEPEGPNPVKYHENIPSNSYFNTGVMVMGLARMRDENLIQQFLDNAPTVIQFWQCADQDIINYTCANRILPLHPKYNYLPDLFRWRPGLTVDGFNAVHHTDYASIAALQADSVIIHLAGGAGSRPWQRSNGLYSPLWLDYFLQSPLHNCNLLLNDPHQSETNKLKTQYSELKKNIEEHQTITARLQTQADHLLRCAEELSAQNERNEKAQKEQGKQISQIEADFNVFREQILRLTQHYKNIQDTQQTLQASLDRLNEGLQSLQTPNHTLKLGFGRYLPMLSIHSSYDPATQRVSKQVKLFGCVPFLSAKGYPYKLHWHLFGFIPIWRSLLMQN